MAEQTPQREPEVRFTWNTHWGCNFRCSYCFFHDLWDHYAPRNVYKSADFWIERWKAVHELYGRCYIVVNGGEPLAYPDFVKIILAISEFHYPINITTNVSVHLDELIEKADPRRISLSLSFHPEYHKDVDKFIAIMDKVRGKGFEGCNNIVAYPPYMDKLPLWLEKFSKAGHAMKINPFIGQYEGKNYPDAFTPEQKKLMGMQEGWVEEKKRRSKLCAAGWKSALILPDGGVTRCGQIGDQGIFANFFDPNFRLLDKPAPCDAERCPCDEWKIIPDETPGEGGAHYLP